jgi:hypothetical protein
MGTTVSAMVNFKVVLDTSTPPPTIVITNPPYDDYTFAYGTAAVAITGTSSVDKYLALSAILDPGAVPIGLTTSKPSSDSFTTYGSASFPNLRAGSYSVTATASDHGITASKTVSFKVGPPAKPTVVISSPVSSPSYLPGTPVNFTYSATSYTGSPPEDLTGTLDGGVISLPWTTNGSTASGSFSDGGLSLGKHTFTVIATDSLQQKSELATVTFNIDAPPPPPPPPTCKVDWRPPVSLDKPFKGGSTVPIKFILTCDGVSIDPTIVIKVWEVFTNPVGKAIRLVSVYGKNPNDGIYTIAPGNGQYHTNFVTAKGSYNYLIEVWRGETTLLDWKLITTDK